MREATPEECRGIHERECNYFGHGLNFMPFDEGGEVDYVDALQACNDSTAPILASVNRCLAARGVV